LTYPITVIRIIVHSVILYQKRFLTSIENVSKTFLRRRKKIQLTERVLYQHPGAYSKYIVNRIFIVILYYIIIMMPLKIKNETAQAQLRIVCNP